MRQWIRRVRLLALTGAGFVVFPPLRGDDSPTAASPPNPLPRPAYAAPEPSLIDLPTVLRLVDANSPTIGFARARIEKRFLTIGSKRKAKARPPGLRVGRLSFAVRISNLESRREFPPPAPPRGGDEARPAPGTRGQELELRRRTNIASLAQQQSA